MSGAPGQILHMPPQGLQYYGPNQQYSFQYSQCTGRKKALIIGINYIGQGGRFKELYGCINDAHIMRNFLRRHYGYNPRDIVMLTEEPQNVSPTRANIIQAMQSFVQNAKPHDSLFFHYSGHGTQTGKPLFHQAVRHRDDEIIPVDWDMAGTIVDDILFSTLVEPLPAGCRLTAVFDCCRSGTVLELPFIYDMHKMDGQRTDADWFKDRRHRIGHPANVICWSGCLNSQRSREEAVWVGQDVIGVGAMSNAFITGLTENPNQSYEHLLGSIRRTLIQEGHVNQTPQLSSLHPMNMNLRFFC